MQHIEYIDGDYFAGYHYKKEPVKLLSPFIAYYWETDFEQLWNRFPEGFTDILFPDIGYTYLINLGTPFIIRFPGRSFEMKIDCLLPRVLPTACHHRKGNRIFGIKFRVAPLMFEKPVNFSEYINSMYSLSYLIDRAVLQQVKTARNFAARVSIVNQHYTGIIKQHTESYHYVNIVSRILEEMQENYRPSPRIEAMAGRHRVDLRTLQRYFAKAIGISPKKALQLIRVRNAVQLLSQDPGRFSWKEFGYYDYSHFYKDVRKFMDIKEFRLHTGYREILQQLQAAQP